MGIFHKSNKKQEPDKKQEPELIYDPKTGSKFYAYTDCDFTHMDLQAVEDDGAFKRCNFTNSNLTDAIFLTAVFSECCFDHTNLNNASFVCCGVLDAMFTQANCARVQIIPEFEGIEAPEGTELDPPQVLTSLFFGTNFYGAEFRAIFKNNWFLGCDFRNAVFKDANFEGCVFNDDIYPQLLKILTLRPTVDTIRNGFEYLNEATPLDAPLVGPEFKNWFFMMQLILANGLKKNNFDGADFTDANLSRADFRGVDLSGAKGLTLKQIQQAITNENTILPSYLTGYHSEKPKHAEPVNAEKISKAEVSHANYSGQLTDEQILQQVQIISRKLENQRML